MLTRRLMACLSSEAVGELLREVLVFGSLALASCGAASIAPPPASETHSAAAIATPAVEPELLIAVGARHACVGLGDALWCWGDDSYGQVGSVGQATEPRAVVGLSGNLRSLAAGGAHTCACNVSGTLYCWGGHRLELCEDMDSRPQRVPGVDCQQVSSGGHRTLVLDSVGHLVEFAERSRYWAATDTCPASDSVEWVRGEVPLTLRARDVSAAAFHACATVDVSHGGEPSGNVVCWGANAHGQLTDDSDLDGVVEVSLGEVELVVAGESDSCAARVSDVVCWGASSLSDAEAAPSSPVRARDSHDGPAREHREFPPRPVPGVGHVRELAVGVRWSCGIADNDDLVCWEHDVSSASDRSIGPAVYARGVEHVDIEVEHGCYATFSRELWCWEGEQAPPGVRLFCITDSGLASCDAE